MRPQRAPKHLRAQADRGERREMKMAAAREVPRGHGEIPVVVQRKLAAWIHEPDHARPHAQHEHDFGEVAEALHMTSLQSKRADEYRRPPARHLARAADV